MENIKKIKKSALVLLAAVSLIMLYFIIITVASFFVFDIVFDGVSSSNPVKNALYFISALVMLSVQIFVVILLLSVKKDETPFNLKNVRLLKSIAILLMVLEPLEVIASRIPTVLSDNTVAVMTYFPSGSIFVAGIVVYCISLVFKYGITLQKQFDETL